MDQYSWRRHHCRHLCRDLGCLPPGLCSSAALFDELRAVSNDRFWRRTNCAANRSWVLSPRAAGSGRNRNDRFRDESRGEAAVRCALRTRALSVRRRGGSLVVRFGSVKRSGSGFPSRRDTPPKDPNKNWPVTRIVLGRTHAAREVGSRTRGRILKAEVFTCCVSSPRSSGTPDLLLRGRLSRRTTARVPRSGSPTLPQRLEAVGSAPSCEVAVGIFGLCGSAAGSDVDMGEVVVAKCEAEFVTG